MKHLLIIFFSFSLVTCFGQNKQYADSLHTAFNSEMKINSDAFADTYNIDTNRIVASGNSAGGHLVLTTALANEINERTDNLNFSASPNLLLVNAGVYNLYAG